MIIMLIMIIMIIPAGQDGAGEVDVQVEMDVSDHSHVRPGL